MSTEKNDKGGKSGGKGSSGASTPTPAEALKEALGDMTPDQKISLLKKAVVNVTKQKAELEAQVSSLQAELEKQKLENATLLKSNADLQKEVDELRTAATVAKPMNVSAAASAAFRGITSLVPGLSGSEPQNSNGLGGAAKKNSSNLSPSNSSGKIKQSGTLGIATPAKFILGEEEAKHVLEDNERLHMQLFDLKRDYEETIQRLKKQLEISEAKHTAEARGALDTATAVGALQAQCGELSAENQRLRGASRAALQMVRLRQNVYCPINDDRTVAELERLNVCWGSQCGAVGPSVSSTSVGALQQRLSRFSTVVEAIIFSLVALTIPSAESIASILGPSQKEEAAVWQLELRGFAATVKSIGGKVTGALSACAACAEGETSQFVVALVDVCRHCELALGCLADRVFVLLHGLSLCSGVPLTEARKEAAQHNVLVFDAVSVLLSWVRTQHSLLELLPQDHTSNPCLHGATSIFGDWSRNSAVADALLSLHGVVLFFVESVVNDKAKLCLQHIAAQLTDVVDEIRHGRGAPEGGGLLSCCTSPEYASAVDTLAAILGSRIADPVPVLSLALSIHVSWHEHLAVSQRIGGEMPVQRGAFSSSSDAFSPGLRCLVDRESDLLSLLHRLDQRCTAYYSQFQCALLELEGRSQLVVRSQNEIQRLTSKLEKEAQERQEICASYDEQIQVLSNRLADLSPTANA